MIWYYLGRLLFVASFLLKLQKKSDLREWKCLSLRLWKSSEEENQCEEFQDWTTSAHKAKILGNPTHSMTIKTPQEVTDAIKKLDANDQGRYTNVFEIMKEVMAHSSFNSIHIRSCHPNLSRKVKSYNSWSRRKSTRWRRWSRGRACTLPRTWKMYTWSRTRWTKSWRYVDKLWQSWY